MRYWFPTNSDGRRGFETEPPLKNKSRECWCEFWELPHERALETDDAQGQGCGPWPKDRSMARPTKE